MTSLRALVLSCAAIAIVGCGATTSTGQDSGGSSSDLQGTRAEGGGSETTTSGAPAPAEKRLPALARTRAQNDALWDAYWATHSSSGSSSSGGGGGPALDPNDLFLSFSDVGVMCSEVNVDLPCGGHWAASIGVPPAFQKPGVYDLATEVGQYSYMSESGPQSSADPNDCGGGGGSFGTGTLEIISIDATTVKFRINAKSYSSHDPNGEYTAVRCP